MNTQTQEALKMAIERLQISNELLITGETTVKNEQAIQACKEALAQPAQEIGDAEIKQMLDDIEYYQKRVEELEQPAQEPVLEIIDGQIFNSRLPIGFNGALYTHPAPSWQGLSDDEIFDLHNKWIMNSGNKDTQYDFARAIEQALKEKNHG